MFDLRNFRATEDLQKVFEFPDRGPQKNDSMAGPTGWTS